MLARVNHPRPPELEILNRLPAVGTPGGRPMGNIPVIVRLLLADGTEMWRPGRANRWTASQVLVLWRNDARDPRAEQMAWLAVTDVTQALHGSRSELDPAWTQLPRWTPPRP